MNNIIVWLYPTINVLVTGLFAGVVVSQYVRRHKTYQLYWSIALTMAFIATLSYVCMLLAQPTSTFGVLGFRLYYMLGAALTAPWLGLGSIALVARANIGRLCMIVLSVLSIVAALLIAFSPLDMQQLGQVAGTSGTNILLPPLGAWLFTIIILNTLGAAAVVGVAIYSGWKLFIRQGTTSLLWANVLITVGALLNGLAGTTARLGVKNIFWLVMTLGWIVFFIGVLLASRPKSHVVPGNKQAMQNRTKNEVKV